MWKRFVTILDRRSYHTVECSKNGCQYTLTFGEFCFAISRRAGFLVAGIFFYDHLVVVKETSSNFTRKCHASIFLGIYRVTEGNKS